MYTMTMINQHFDFLFFLQLVAALKKRMGDDALRMARRA